MSRPSMHVSSRSYSYYTAGTGSNEVTTLRHFIRSIDGSQVASILQSSDKSLLPAEISVREKIRVGSKELNFRRVYLMNHMYKVGWAVDYDIDLCMLCGKDFSWLRGRAKHHCRACGLLICYKCSPNVAEVPYLGEEKESRVCKECFGIKPGVMTPQQKNDMIEELVKTVEEEEKFVQLHREEQEQLLQQSMNRVSYQSSQTLTKPSPFSKKSSSQSLQSEAFSQRSLSTNNRSSAANASNRPYSPTPSLSSARVVLFATPDDVANNTTRDSFRSASSRKAVSTLRRQSSTNSYAADDTMLDRYEEEMRRWEIEQRPLYEESYRMMRELIPLDIYKSSMRRLVDQGLPILAANRIWNTKILWLISTHRDDIVKIHLADFRSKYAYDGLDLIEMRAIWYNLPEWDVYSSNPLEKGKAEWKDGLKAKLDEMSYKEARGTLPLQYCRHPAYDDCTLLHIFNPDIDLRPRFHRSASFKQQAIESPLEVNRPLTKEEEEDLIWRAKYAAATPDPGVSIQDRKKVYMDNFRDENGADEGYSGAAKQRKYQRLVDEINGEDEGDDEDYVLDDDISSLGLESNVQSEANTPFYSSQYHQTPYSSGRQRMDITVNSITTIPELTTPESTSSLQDHTKDISPIPSPKVKKQPRSQLLQQSLPLNSANNTVGGSKKSKSQQRKGDSKRQSRAQIQEEDEEDEDSKARAREEFLASRRAMNKSKPSSTAPIPTSTSSVVQGDSASVASGVSSANGSGSSSASGMSNSVKSNSIKPIGSSGNMRSQDLPNNTTTNTSRNSSFSTANSYQSQSRVNATVSTQQVPNAPKSLSFSSSVSQQSATVSGATATSTKTVQANKSRDTSPLPLLRHQPTPPRKETQSAADDDEEIVEQMPVSNERPFLPLTRAFTQVIDDQKDKEEASVDEAEEDEEDTKIDTRRPTFLSPSEMSSTSDAASIGGDTFRSVDSMDIHATPMTPASAQSYKFLSHSKKFGVTIDDSPSVLLTTQQKRHQQRVLLSQQRSIERGERLRSHLTPNNYISQSLVYTTNEKPVPARNRGLSHDTQNKDLYQPGSDDRSYRRASAITSNPIVTPIATSQYETQRSTSSSPMPPINDSEYDMVPDRLANDADGVSPTPSPYVSSGQSVTGGVSTTSSSSSRVNQASLRADIMRALFEEDTELVYEYLGDSVLSDVFSSEADLMILSRIFWQCLLMQRYQTVLFLVDEAVMDIDVVCEDPNAQAEQDGRTALHYAVMENAESFGRQLIRRGANIFAVNHSGDSPLSMTLKYSKITWLIEEYQQSGEEDVLSSNGSDEDKFQYMSFFVMTGISTKVKSLLATDKFSLSSKQATNLLNACKGNFEQMEDPVDTFEILMSLGAEMGD